MNPHQQAWEHLCSTLEAQFGKKPTFETLLLLIGMQEMQIILKGLKKEVKVDLMHVAICTLLQEDGYYKLVNYDDEGWPHFELIKPLPELSLAAQIQLLQEKIITYFQKNGIITL